MKIQATFYSLTGKFSIVKREEFESVQDGFNAARTYAESHGFRNVDLVNDEDSYRVTATTPNGRSGRNIATLDFMGEW